MKVAGGGAVRGRGGETGGPGIKRYDISHIYIVENMVYYKKCFPILIFPTT